MSARRLAAEQPASFAFTPENLAWAKQQIAKYPAGRQASAIVPIIWRAQEQQGGYVTEPMLRVIGEMLGLSYIRVYEIATFYTMFNLAPVGRHLVQVCTTTPCMLRGSDDVVAACKKMIGPKPHTVYGEGLWSWMEVECLGACVNAPMLQIGSDYYEDLDAASTEKLLADLKSGKAPKPGSQIGRHSSEPRGGPTTLKEVKA
ncbi:MAG: NADH-quinone oxidoreductase subunit NuoE [Alphaproteobacteria bacterium]|nr:NADH-quinone oxidoreductase subunit NuoE [Alphaproteobacteria bacterium]